MKYLHRIFAPVAALLFQCHFIQTFSSKVFRTKGQSPEQFTKSIEKLGSVGIKSISKETVTVLETKLKSSTNQTQMQYQLHNFYLPMFYYISNKRNHIFEILNKQLKHGDNLAKSTLFIGISAPQVHIHILIYIFSISLAEHMEYCNTHSTVHSPLKQAIIYFDSFIYLFFCRDVEKLH
jgi:hypothetical protein